MFDVICQAFFKIHFIFFIKITWQIWVGRIEVYGKLGVLSFKKLYLFIWKTEWQGKRGEEKWEKLPFSGLLPSGHSSCDWSIIKPGTRSWQAPKAGASSAAFPGQINRELDRKQSIGTQNHAFCSRMPSSQLAAQPVQHWNGVLFLPLPFLSFLSLK